MLFKILKPFGIDLAARMAEVWIDLEERFDLAKDSAEQAVQTAGVLGTLFFLAGLAALSAFGVGLVALYSWVSSNYGHFYGFAVIATILLFLAVVTFAIAVNKSKSCRGESGSRVAARKLELAQARAKRIATATEAFEGPALRAPPPYSGATAAGDLLVPLLCSLSRTIKLPTMGNPIIDELFARLQSSARDVADETVDGLVRTVRDGERLHLFAALGGAVFVGWCLGRHSRVENRGPGAQ